MFDRSSHHRFVAVLLVGALTLVGVGITGIGGLPGLAVATIVVLGTVDACFRSVVNRHGETPAGAEGPTEAPATS